jgi:hypothetical protein
MSSIYSNRLEKRNFQLKLDNNFSNFGQLEKGEITGDRITFDNIDQGMPIRGNFIPNKNDKKVFLDNQINDFSLFDKNNNNNNNNQFKINYYDPYENNNNLSNIKNLDQTDVLINNNINRLSNNIDEYGYFLFNNIQKYLLKNTYLLSSFNLHVILSSLFVASKNKTSQELKNYLNLNDRSKTMADLNLFYSELEKIKYIDILNFFIVPYECKINKTFVSYLPCMKILNYDSKDSKDTDLNIESVKINKYISNCHNYNFTNTIKSNYLKDQSIIALISGKIEPIWENNFDDIITDIFVSYTKRQQTFIVSRNKDYYYFSHEKLQLLEIPCYDKKVSFGIITTSDTYFPTINNDTVNYMISNLAPTNFKYLILPQIKENLKMRYTNILKESGLQTIFNNIEIPELILDTNINLNDILQNIYLVIDKNNDKNNNNKNTTMKTQNKPIVKKIDTPFIYYIRLNTINTILCLGQYC